MSEPLRWQLETLHIRVSVPYWPLEDDLTGELLAGLMVWASGVASAAGAMLDGGARIREVTIIDGPGGVVICEIPVKPKPEGSE